MSRTARKRFLLVGNITEVLKMRNERCKHTFTCQPNKEHYYTVYGKKVSVQEFNQMFPVDFKPIEEKGSNPDRTKSWMHGSKSY